MIFYGFWVAYAIGALVTFRQLVLHFKPMAERKYHRYTDHTEAWASYWFSILFGTVFWFAVATGVGLWKLMFPHGIVTKAERHAALEKNKEQEYQRALKLIQEWDATAKRQSNG